MSVPFRGHPPAQQGARRERRADPSDEARAGGSRLRETGDGRVSPTPPWVPSTGLQSTGAPRGTPEAAWVVAASRRAGAQPPPSKRPSRGRSAAAPRPGRLRVVVVEDEAIIAMELEMLLSSLGAEVVATAMSADEAVRLAEAERPDCMTMDIRLQGDRDGVSAAVEIYERFGIRSVFVSAYSDPGTVARGERAHPLGWVAKPIHQDKLEAGLRKLAERSSGS